MLHSSTCGYEHIPIWFHLKIFVGLTQIKTQNYLFIVILKYHFLDKNLDSEENISIQTR